MNTKLTHAFIAIGVACLVGCKSDIIGIKTENLLPQTFTVTDTIIRLGDSRYTTKVQVRWWATDRDGFVKGYEIATDRPIKPSTVWRFTQSTDSIFTFVIPEGKDTSDFMVSIRAIDNNNAKDASPAQIIVPIKNSKPLVAFQYVPDGGNPLSGGNQTLAYPVLKLTWKASDPDGFDNLKHTEIYLNDTTRTPFVVPALFGSVVVIGNDLTGSSTACNVLVGNSNIPNSQTLAGLLLNDSNRFYCRSVDLSGAKSPLVRSKTIFVKKPKSKILLVNAYTDGDGLIDQFYQTQLAAQSIFNFDLMQLLKKDRNQYTQLAPDNRTQNLVFGLFDHIVWYGGDLDFSMVYAQNTLVNFLNSGGNLLLSVKVAGSSPLKTSFYDFSPIDSLKTAPNGTTLLLADSSKIRGIANNGYPILTHSEFNSAVRPIKFVDGTSVLLTADILSRDNTTFDITNYTGARSIMGLKTNSVSGSKFIFSALQLHKLNGANNIGLLFQKILIDEFRVR